MKFAKLEGLGNDYLFTEDTPKNPSRAARLLCDRHYGVGADGLVIILPPDHPKADFMIRIFNPDGSEAEMCGNAIRCLGKYLYDRGKTEKQKLNIETMRGLIPTVLMVRDGRVYRVKADMGEPILARSQIPMQYAPGEENNTVQNEKLILDDHQTLDFTAVSMGNPHVVIWLQDGVDEYPVEKYGPYIESSSMFPNRTNVHFVQMLDEDHVKQRVWERGVGETMACGTGACAAVVAGVLDGKIKRKTKVELKGGILEIYWSEKDNHVYMTGPCKDVFEGETNII